MERIGAINNSIRRRTDAKGLTCVAVQNPLNHSLMRYAEAVGKSSLTCVFIQAQTRRKTRVATNPEMFVSYA